MGGPRLQREQRLRDSLDAGEAYPGGGAVKWTENTPCSLKPRPLRRSNTDCEAGMNPEVSADLKRNPRVSGVEQSRARRSQSLRCWK